MFSKALSAAAVAKVGYEGYQKKRTCSRPWLEELLLVTGIGFLPCFATRKIVSKMQGI